MATITSANSVLMLGIVGLFPVPVRIEGFATDDMFTLADIDSKETMMGADGHLSAGWIPVVKPFEINLQADSPSNFFFDALIQAEELAREAYVINGSILLSGTNTLYILTRGFLKTHSPMPSAKKVLQPRKFSLEFEKIFGAPV